MLHHILHCFSFFVLSRQNDRQINGNRGIGNDCPTPPKISALKRFPAFLIHGMFEEKTRTLEAQNMDPKAPPEPEELGIQLEF